MIINKESWQGVITALLVALISYSAVAYINEKHGDAMSQIEVQKTEINNLKTTIDRIDRNILFLLERRK